MTEEKTTRPALDPVVRELMIDWISNNGPCKRDEAEQRLNREVAANFPFTTVDMVRRFKPIAARVRAIVLLEAADFAEANADGLRASVQDALDGNIERAAGLDRFAALLRAQSTRAPS